MPLECQTCHAIRAIAADYGDPSILCPDCRRGAPMLPGDAAAMMRAAVPARPTRRDDDDDDRPEPKGKATSRGGAGLGLGMIIGIVVVLLGCCLCLPVGGIGVALVVPAIQKVREAAARTESTNNLKRIGLGVHGFHDLHKRLPFNGSSQPPANAPGVKYSADAIASNPMSGSWGFQILPQMEEHALFENTANRTIGVKSYLCPGRGRPPVEGNGGGAWTDYFYNNYLNDPNQAMRPDAPDMRRTFVQVTDGTSNTIFFGHGNINRTGYAATNVAGSSNIFKGGTNGTMRSGGGGVQLRRDMDAMPPNSGNWGGPFPQGALMCMGDGSVRMFPYSAVNFPAFLTPTGNEPVNLPD
jgi:hypothetical protein